jgi:glycosyltransferase involved in cell wall biosynthesis
MAQATSTSRPLVSVVTPFYNTAPYLAQCIESVLAQTYPHFEHILMDNCSIDGSAEIAERYARRNPRIRLIRCSEFLQQIPNYNRALSEISNDSKYTKIVEADNHIFPDCLRLMVEVFEKSDSIGLVSSYCLQGRVLRGSGYPYPMAVVSGREWGAQHLLGIHVFGSPTQVMYRSIIIRDAQPFFDEAVPHADSHKCLDVLAHWDFGFVPQVLAFLRADNESISSAVSELQDGALDRYITERRYAPIFFASKEAELLNRKAKRRYYRALARQVFVLRGGGSTFWRHHKVGLKTLGERIDWPYLGLAMFCELLWLAANPGMTTMQALRHWKSGKEAAHSLLPDADEPAYRRPGDRLGDLKVLGASGASRTEAG